MGKCVRVPIMTDSVLTELNCRPCKIPKFHNACEGSKSSNIKRKLKERDVYNDEYVRQYILFHYQYKKSEGFTIDWEQFDYVFPIRSFDNSPNRISDTRSHAEMIREVTLFAIEKHNEAKGTKLVFVEHIRANYLFLNGLVSWLTFWAMDMNSSSPESKIYQAKVWRLGKLRFDIPIFRLKPTEEEIASVEVEPPAPLECDSDDYPGTASFSSFFDPIKPAVVFARPGPNDDTGLPFVFHRTEAGRLCPPSN
ncbi:unnamed protein product [Thlaspi arvense]|uniref:Uncharacterized protein n=1 Tax=Thlaspi arvense TaxID=13288 RepID=A0AAU9SMQ5_THLAR|nr:unnamed protein product [Thlaspi arvense]